MAHVSDLVVASGRIREGRLFIHNRRDFDRQLAQMPERWTLEVSVKRLAATRSHHQNAYYWGVVIDRLVQHCDHNYTPEEMHELCKARFIPKTLALHDGNGEVVCEFVMGGSTRTLNKVQFGEYVESVRRWAADALALDIPDPDPDWNL
jgi:hypothetical protein